MPANAPVPARNSIPSLPFPVTADMSSSPIRILLVDDDQEDYTITRDLLTENSPKAYEIEWVDGYDRALEIMSQRQHDIYLIDFWLGTHNGLELLKQAQSRGNTTPMILLTGLEDEVVDLEAMRAGAADFLCKGHFTSKSLERSIRYAIERSRAELEIQKLAAFPRTNPNPVLAFDSQGAMTYANDAAQNLATSLGESSVLKIMPVGSSAIIAACLLSKESKIDIQTTIRGRTVSWSFTPIANSKTVHCYATDITERLNLEAQVRHATKMEAVGQLAAGVAHDFNNILTIIQGHSDLLSRNSNLGPESQKPVQQICTAAERAGKIIRQLLMFSRKHALQPRVIDLNDVVSNTTAMLKALLGEQIRLDVSHTPGLPAVLADIAMIEQVLINLTVNARDAMPNGGSFNVSIAEVWFEPNASDTNPDARFGQFVALKFKDSGCGMDKNTLDHLFEPFFTTKETGKGTGLGLATVYGIVKQHQGWIVVDSRLHTGTTFTIYLPAVASNTQPKPSLSLTSASTEGGSEGILVVEDEGPLRELVVNVLELYGYQTFQAATGGAAVKLWAEHKDKISLLLTDMVMPEGMSGPQLAQRLMKDDPKLKVIYTSGYSPGLLTKDIALMEGSNFLPKPYKPMRLAQMIRECLDEAAGKNV